MCKMQSHFITTVICPVFNNSLLDRALNESLWNVGQKAWRVVSRLCFSPEFKNALGFVNVLCEMRSCFPPPGQIPVWPLFVCLFFFLTEHRKWLWCKRHWRLSGLRAYYFDGETFQSNTEYWLCDIYIKSWHYEKV